MLVATVMSMKPSRPLNVTDVTDLARAVASEHAGNLNVRGVTAKGDSDYAEVLIDDEGRCEPCRFAIGVFRNEAPEAIKRDIASRLSRHVHPHM